MIKWAGRILAFIGGGHLTIGMLMSLGFYGDWFSLSLWGHWWEEDNRAANAFWGNPAGFGWPLLLVGLLVMWMDRKGIVPPAFLGWAVLGWALVCAVVAEPTPGPVLVGGAVLLILGVRKATTARRT